MSSAVVFAYHNVGVRCLGVLLARGVEVALVVTHEDNPGEHIWFDSVRALALLHGIPTVTPIDPNAPEIVARVRALTPDFLFSFYYRLMLKAPLLAIPKHGAWNLHGSLLPRYRGRAPVNWAVINGETETGATLHRMVEKADAGAIAGQQAVPILPNDTAGEVFNKVTVAAELILYRVLSKLINGSIELTPQQLEQGSYFGGRTPTDGSIDWSHGAQRIHNLVRGVAPPYPGAFSYLAGHRIRILKTLLEPGLKVRSTDPGCYTMNDCLYADCADGTVLRIVAAELDGSPLDVARFPQLFRGTSSPFKIRFDPW